MIFKYKALNDKGEAKEGIVDSVNKDLAIGALQRRGLVVVSIKEEQVKSGFSLNLFQRIPVKDVVVVSRQISTLFEANVSALKAFSLLAANAENDLLSHKLTQVVDDLQAGFSISGALSKHPDVFSDFYISMVRAGEESGKLTQTFSYLADYLDRQYELNSKTKNALIYPAFVVFTFFVVMALMMVVVIPKLSVIILESGQDIPFYTKIVIGMSSFFVDYGIFFIIFLILFGLYIFRLTRSESGKIYMDNLKLSLPGLGDLYKKVYLARIADNLDTMLSSGISIVRAIEISGDVVGNRVYHSILKESTEAVKGGSSLSDAMGKSIHVPSLMVQMMKVGEETGSLSSILKTLAKFYKREVDGAIDTLVSLIEPVMIVFLGLGVGLLLTSVLVPIYNLASGIQ
ncbi:MAG: type II secretion system F family protein [Candidatus Paceibacterota bacterium]|jgi:type IV pilus assembly protein PilC